MATKTKRYAFPKERARAVATREVAKGLTARTWLEPLKNGWRLKVMWSTGRYEARRNADGVLVGPLWVSNRPAMAKAERKMRRMADWWDVSGVTWPCTTYHFKREN